MNAAESAALRTLQAMVNKAVQWNEITRNPIVSVAAPRSLDSKPPRFYTTDELALLYAIRRLPCVPCGREQRKPKPASQGWGQVLPFAY